MLRRTVLRTGVTQILNPNELSTGEVNWRLTTGNDHIERVDTQSIVHHNESVLREYSNNSNLTEGEQSLVDSVREAASDPVVVERIVGSGSFQNFLQYVGPQIANSGSSVGYSTSHHQQQPAIENGAPHQAASTPSNNPLFAHLRVPRYIGGSTLDPGLRFIPSPLYETSCNAGVAPLSLEEKALNRLMELSMHFTPFFGLCGAVKAAVGRDFQEQQPPTAVTTDVQPRVPASATAPSLEGFNTNITPNEECAGVPAGRRLSPLEAQALTYIVPLTVLTIVVAVCRSSKALSLLNAGFKMIRPMLFG